MALQPIPGFCTGSYVSRSRGAAFHRLVNGLVELNHPAGKGQATIIPRAGKQLFAEQVGITWKGCWANRERVFAISSDGHLYEVMQDGTFTDRGSGIVVNSSPVYIRSNGNQLMVVSGDFAYVATGTTLIRPVVSFARGYATVTGTTVTWVSGDKYGDVTGSEYISFDDGTVVYTDRVNVAFDDEHLQLIHGYPPDGTYFVQIGDSLLTGRTLEYIDGFFIVSLPDSNTFQISRALNGKIWDVLDANEKSGTTDYIAAIADLGGQLALIGDNRSTEIWGDTGDVDQPFQRIDGRSMNCGTDAFGSVAKMPDGSLIWLYCAEAGREMIVRTTGGEPQRISNHALENAMRGYARIDDAIGSTFLENGHPCYRIDFPTANRTWVFDDSSGMWSEFGIDSGTPEVYAADEARFNCHVKWPNGTRMRLGFDYSSGKIWKISPDYLDDDGTDFEILRQFGHVVPDMEPVVCSKFALDCEMGTLPAGVNGADGKPLIPKVSLNYSIDAGYNWTDGGDASLGRNTEYQGTYLSAAEIFDGTPSSQTNPQTFEPMPIWNNLGRFQVALTLKVKSTGKQLRAIYNALIELTK